MADRLEDMMYRVCILKDQYQRLKDQLESSMFSEYINAEDNLLINGISFLIDDLEQKINKEIDLLNKTIRISDVTLKALAFFGKITTTYSAAEVSYKKWKSAILSVSESYINAYNSFEKIMKEQKEHQENIANIAASVASVLSMGALSWVSTAIQISDEVISHADTIKNVTEDVFQGFSDKFISHVVPKQVKPIVTKPKGPLMFKNNITQDLIKGCVNIFEEMVKIMDCINQFTAKGSDLSSKNIGRIGGSKDSLIFFEAYRQLLKETQPIIAMMSNWNDIHPPEINKETLTRDFEINFWAKWIISLEKHPIVSGIDVIYKRNDKGEVIDITDIVETKKEDKSRIVYRKFYWSHSLKSKLEELFKLNNTVIEGGDLGIYVSVSEIERLVKWAKNYKPVQAL